MELIRAPRISVIPDVFSTTTVKMIATTATTIAIVLYSVFINVLAPLLMMPAISFISALPSSIFSIFI